MAAKYWAVTCRLQVWVGVENEGRRVLMSFKKVINDPLIELVEFTAKEG